MSTTVNIHEAKTHLSRLLQRVRQGEVITIAKAGEPVAELRPVTRADVVFGGLKGSISYDDDAFTAADSEVAAMFDESIDA